MSVINVSTVLKREKRSNNKSTKNPNNRNHEEFNEKSIESIELEEGDIENLLLHNSDKIIKPIIGNKIIETLPQTTYNKIKIPLQIWKTEKIKEYLKSNNFKPVENYLLGIYSLMENYYYANGNEENLLNILNYFETIIQDKEIANKIINTSFITLLILILKNLNASKQVCYLVKIRICTIIAYLIRYSTMIESPLDELGLTGILENLVQNGKTLEMAKRAIATLGEYLFFVATQAEGEEVVSNWVVSEDSLGTLLWALDPNRDEVIKFYAVKSIENISALTSVAEMYFANSNFISAVIEIYLISKLHELRISAIYTVSHLIRLNPKLFEVLISKISFKVFLAKFINEVPKIQQAMINCLIFGAKQFGRQLMQDLTTLINNNKLNNNEIDVIKKDEFGAVLSYLIENVESGSSTSKMKLVLLFNFFLTDLSSIVLLNDLKLFQTITKLKKDPHLELRQSIKFFENTVSEKMIEFTKLFKSTLNGYFSSISNQSNKKVDFLMILSTLVSCLKVFSIIGISSKLLFQMYVPEFLEKIIEILYCNELIQEEDIQVHLFTILINFSENKSLVEENSEFVINKMFIPILQCCFV